MSQPQVLLEWSFTPPDFFEQDTVISRSDYKLTIANGRAVCEIDPNVFDANPSMRDDIHRALLDRFRGAQLVSHAAFKLSGPELTRVKHDGSRAHFVEMHAALKLSGQFDVKVTDGKGNVLSDTRQERIDEKTRLADATEAHGGDVALASATQSYSQSVQDPKNELVHLYEVRDAFSKRFGDKKAALKALGVSENKWSRLGQLSNDEPLKQGRHRGKVLGQLRDATEAELSEARSIARELIEGYIAFLGSSGRGP